MIVFLHEPVKKNDKKRKKRRERERKRADINNKY